MAKTTKSKAKVSVKKAPDTGMAIVAYILFFVPLLTESKNDPFVMFHVKQGLVLLIAWVALSIFAMIPILNIFALPLYLIMFVLWIMGILNAVNGVKKELPVIGKYADKITL